jgi:hypothetical protein
MKRVPVPKTRRTVAEYTAKAVEFGGLARATKQEGLKNASRPCLVLPASSESARAIGSSTQDLGEPVAKFAAALVGLLCSIAQTR